MTKYEKVDYSRLSPKTLFTPEYRHLLLLGGWIVYFALYLITENLIPEGSCHLVHNRLDEIIPFTEFFVVFYVYWYIYVAGSLLWYLGRDVDSFRRMQLYIIITQLVAMAIYIIWPSYQDLRPAEMPRNNVFTWILSIIYAADTPTGVMPSLHVAYSLGIASVWAKDGRAPKSWRILAVVLAAIISASTALVKQHSTWDILGALILGVFAETIVFWDYWKAKLFKKGDIK